MNTNASVFSRPHSKNEAIFSPDAGNCYDVPVIPLTGGNSLIIFNFHVSIQVLKFHIVMQHNQNEF
jgi:hypothetical protein